MMKKKYLILLVVMSLITSNSSNAQDVIGKLVVGYQGWFACQGDGSPKNAWNHWAKNSTIPAPNNQTFELWPDVREFSKTYQTGYANLGNGQPAQLYSSYDDQVVNKHFEWMQQYGIDCVALQRFGSELTSSTMKPHRDGMAQKVKNAAITYERKFYIMYDISGWTNFQTEIKTDWTNTIVGMLKLTSSPAYAKENSKPVVCIWGPGVSGRPGNVTSWLEVINWFKSQGCYVIVGSTKTWRSQTANLPAFNAGNMISPWIVGGYFDAAGADDYANTVMTDDIQYCKANSIEFQPVILPGFAWSNWNSPPQNKIARMHGDFMWRQFYNIRNKGVVNMYVAMFDEFDEGTAIAKAAENASMKPSNQYFLTLDADGVACSSDFYLRLTGDGAKMVKGLIELTPTHPTPHITVSGINKPNDSGKPIIKMYPNPLLYGTLSIEIDYTGIWTRPYIQISNLMGQIVYQKPITSKTIKINTTGLLYESTYLVAVLSEQSTVTKLLVVQ